MTEQLEMYAKRCEELRTSLLFNDPDWDAGLDPLAVQEFLAAVAHLQLAETCLAKAKLHQARGLASSSSR